MSINYSPPLFVVLVKSLYSFNKKGLVLFLLILATQLFFFKRMFDFAAKVDKKEVIPAGYYTELFPFVNYTMYSGENWFSPIQSFYFVEADGKHFYFTSLPIISEEMFANTIQYFNRVKNNGMKNPELDNDVNLRLMNTPSDSTLFIQWVKNRFCNVYDVQCKNLKLKELTVEYDIDFNPIWKNEQIIFELKH